MEKDLEQVHVEKLEGLFEKQVGKDWIFLMGSMHAEPMKELN